METLLFDRYIILLLKAVLFLAKHKNEQKYFKVKEIAESLNVSKSYMARIIQGLVHNKILESSTGPTGGLEAENAVQKWRDLIGATDPKDAKEGTIRKLYAKSKEANAVHGSDSVENALKEIHYFFSERELLP